MKKIGPRLVAICHLCCLGVGMSVFPKVVISDKYEAYTVLPHLMPPPYIAYPAYCQHFLQNGFPTMLIFPINLPHPLGSRHIILVPEARS